MGTHSGENTKDKQSKLKRQPDLQQNANNIKISTTNKNMIKKYIHFGKLNTRNNMNNLYTSQTKTEPCKGFLLFKILDSLKWSYKQVTGILISSSDRS